MTPRFGHVLMPSLVLCYDVPKLLDVVLLKVDSSFHGIQAYGLGTYFCLILKHAQHVIDHDRTTSVLLHVLCTQLQAIPGGLLPQLLHVPIDLQLDLVLVLRFSEGTYICSCSYLAIGCSGLSTCVGTIFFVIMPCHCYSSCFCFFSCSLLLISSSSLGSCFSYYDLSYDTYKLCFSLFLFSVVCVLCFPFLPLLKLLA